MQDLTIDFSAITSSKIFYEDIAYRLNFSEYFGENLDALWDELTCINFTLRIVLKNTDLRFHDEFLAQLWDLLNDVQFENKFIKIKVLS